MTIEELELCESVANSDAPMDNAFLRQLVPELLAEVKRLRTENAFLCASNEGAWHAVVEAELFEREACAREVEKLAKGWAELGGHQAACICIAHQIRARKSEAVVGLSYVYREQTPHDGD